MASNAFLYLTPHLFGSIFQCISSCLCHTFALPLTGCASLCLLLPVMLPHYYSTDHASFKMPPLPRCQLQYFPLTLISVIFLLLSYLWCTLLGYLVTDVSRQCFPQLCILTLAHIGVADRSSENKVSIMENITKQSQHDFPLNALQGTSRHYFFIKLLLITALCSY